MTAGRSSQNVRYGAIHAHRGSDIVQRITAQAMAQCGGGYAFEVGVGDGGIALQCGVGTRGANQRQVATQTIGAQSHAQLGSALTGRIADAHGI